MLKLVMMPPQIDLHQQWAKRLEQALPQYRIATPETDDEAQRELADAAAAYGWVSPEALPAAQKLRWLQNPQAGPTPGYYYPELIEHPVVVCNPRGIYFDHISHHIMMFVLALSRGLPYYMEAQRQQRWDKEARQSPYIYLADATALIVGVGGIGHETARLCTAFGMTVLGTDPPSGIRNSGCRSASCGRSRSLITPSRLCHFHHPAYTGDRGHMADRAVPAHEVYRLLHQCWPGKDDEDRRPRRRD